MIAVKENLKLKSKWALEDYCPWSLEVDPTFYLIKV